ncbi:MAG: hypothetical protein KGD68_04575, partial [Candidatus Lokiarchaeota archaeon]|nr:hypothetical protein [Candidatus Lokiarchaeota archaeon]
MNKQENFMKIVYEIASELKLPLMDERVQDSVKFKLNNAIVSVKFVFEEDESVIRGFLGLAEYFHTVIIKQKDKFYIPHDQK